MKNGPDLVIGYLPKLNKIVFIETKNFRSSKEDMLKLTQACIESVYEVDEKMNEVIRDSYKEKLEYHSNNKWLIDCS